MFDITEQDLIDSIRSKRVPAVRARTSCADLSLQEVEIVNSIRSCDSLEKVNVLIDKFLVYIAMSKCLEVSNGRFNASED